jgi:glycine betaine/proline transport system substrate-binding protein
MHTSFLRGGRGDEGRKTHMAGRSSRTRLAAFATVVGLGMSLGLTACGGGDIEEADPEASGGSDCGDLRIAINPWTGYVSNAHVIGQVAKEKLGCNVTYPEVKEEVGWQGMADGSIDTIVENWGHADLVAKYIDDQGSVQDAGLTGNDGIIGWYVPPWLAEEHPEVLDWENLNDFADEFATAESGDMGQLLNGDPGYTSYDTDIVRELGLDFEVVQSGSEEALITAIERADRDGTPLLTYWWTPHWLNAEIEMAEVQLPPYSEECYEDLSAVACAYPDVELPKYLNADFAENGGDAAEFLRNFNWTTEDQDYVAQLIQSEGMDPQDAAQQWVEENPDKVEAWLP